MKNSFASIVISSLLALTLGAGFARASDQVIEKRVNADTPEKFAEVQQQIREDMNTGGRYEFMRADEKSKAETDLGAIAAMLQKNGSVAAMSQDEKVQLFNAQEHLNGLLTHSDRNRLICQRHPPMGTNIPVTTCKTVGELEKERRDSQKLMQDADRKGWTCMSPNPACPHGG